LQLIKISEIAKELNVSKTAVYKKIDKLKPSFNKYIKTYKGVKHVTTEGFDVLKKAFGVSTKVETVETIGLNEITKLLLTEKDKHIEQLTKQLANKEKALSKALDLANQTQHLLAIEKQQVLQLQAPEKKSFWSKFKKSQPNQSWDSEGR
jgi:transcriptional antiterminator